LIDETLQLDNVNLPESLILQSNHEEEILMMKKCRSSEISLVALITDKRVRIISEDF
jgi:hypothetical protein